MTAPENPAAFPVAETDWNNAQHGMTLRDWFAGQALNATIPAVLDASLGGAPDEQIASLVYKLADAMLAERAKVQP